MSAPMSDVIRATHGYHPVTTDLEEILRAGLFEQLLVFGPGVNDIVGLVSEVRLVTTLPVELPQGVYWFSGAEPAIVLSVAIGASPVASSTSPAVAVPAGSALDNALGWVDEAWESASLRTNSNLRGRGRCDCQQLGPRRCGAPWTSVCRGLLAVQRVCWRADRTLLRGLNSGAPDG